MKTNPQCGSLNDDQLLRNVPEMDGYKILGRTLLLAKVGQGGMGAVYRAIHVEFENEVAVKCLFPSIVEENPAVLGRFRREAKLGACVSHQNVVRLFDTGSESGLHYLVLEYVRGETARERVIRKRDSVAGRGLPIDEAIAILHQAAVGLAEAHRRGVVHRDIKPDNILITVDGLVKVADLGLGRAVDSAIDDGVTLSGVVVGTPRYMPPEQWSGIAEVGPTGDVWALGATLYYLLTGCSAYSDSSHAVVAHRIVNEEFPDIRKALPDVAEPLATVINIATAKDPGARYEDAGAFAKALATLTAGEGAFTPLDDREASRSSSRCDLVSPPPAQLITRVRDRVSGDRKSHQGGEQRRGDDRDQSPALTMRVGLTALAACCVLFLLAAGAYLGPSWRAGARRTETTGPVLQVATDNLVHPLPYGEIGIEGTVDGASIVSVTIDGNPASLENGRFRGTLPARNAGSYEAQVVAIDVLGNRCTVQVPFRIDNAPPEITIIEPKEGAVLNTTSVLVQVKAFDDSTVEFVSINGEPAVFSNGTYSVEVPTEPGSLDVSVVATDGAGNDTPTLRRRVTIDTEAPTLELTSPVPEQELAFGEISFEGRVVDASAVTVTVGGMLAEVSEGRFRTRLPAHRVGAGEVRLIARDEAGNTQELVAPVRLDATPPQIELLSPKDGSVLGNAAFDVQLRVSDRSKIESVTVNGTRAAATGGDYVARVECTPGVCALAITAKDVAGNVARISWRGVSVDTQEPVVLVTSPSANVQLPYGPVTVVGTVEDTSAVVVEVEGEAAIVSGGQFRATLPTRKRGSSDVLVRATDEAGNTTELLLPIHIDSEAPKIRILEPTDGDLLEGNVVPVRLTVEDLSAIDYVWVNGREALLSGGSFVAEISAEPGPLQISAIAADTAGNKSAQVRSLVTIAAGTRVIPGFVWTETNTQGYEEYRHNQTNLVFVLIPGGRFVMGSPDTERGRQLDEGPAHRVALSDFLIAKYEVTQAQWRGVAGSAPARFADADGMAPVESISWIECKERFLSKTGLELPSEAQWEYACRAGSESRYHSGDLERDLARASWCKRNSGGRTHPVGEKEPNAFGLYDMHGNVAEWCRDTYDRAFYASPRASGRDPIQDERSNLRVVRGGSCFSPPEFARSAVRLGMDAGRVLHDVGFRPVLTLR